MSELKPYGEITLTPEQVRLGFCLGWARDAMCGHSTASRFIDKSKKASLLDHCFGACGEIAFCEITGCIHTKAVNGFREIADVWGRNRWDLEVRTRKSHDYDLYIYENERVDQIYALMTTTHYQFPKFKYWGVIRGEDAKQPQYWVTPYTSPLRKECFLIKKELLVKK